MNDDVVQGLWIGDSLSVMEQLSVASFIANGHEYHLYLYEDLDGIPEGTVVKDADGIVPRERIFKYKDRDTYAGFADLFRYKLLFEKGGYWADTDVVCLRPFDFQSDYVFGEEGNKDGSTNPCNSVMKVPVGSEIMQFCYDISSRTDPDKLAFAETGPILVTEAVRRFRLANHVLPKNTFHSIDWWDWKDIISGKLGVRIRTWLRLASGAYAVHLCNEMWRMGEADKNGTYHPRCLYERLKRRYLGPCSRGIESGQRT